MKALTIRQPWASLIALGVKTIETRSWRAPQSLIGQTIAIHAGKAIGGRHLDQFGEWTLHVSPYIEDDGNPWQLRRLGAVERDGHTLNMEHVRVLPLGAIVATATLADCVPMVDDYELGQTCLKIRADNHTLWTMKAGDHPADAANVTEQLPYGDFAPGRWAWLLDDVKPTTERCPDCMGDGFNPGVPRWMEVWCSTCHHQRTCPPIPAKGKQGLWTWESGS